MTCVDEYSGRIGLDVTSMPIEASFLLVCMLEYLNHEYDTSSMVAFSVSYIDLLCFSTTTHTRVLRLLVHLIHMRKHSSRVLLIHQVMQIVFLRR
jgi:hypothetical protein